MRIDETAWKDKPAFGTLTLNLQAATDLKSFFLLPLLFWWSFNLYCIEFNMTIAESLVK